MSKPEIMSDRRGDDTLIERGHGTGSRWWWPYAAVATLAALALAVMIWQLVARGPFVAADWRIHAYFFPRVADGAARFALDTLSRPGQRWLTLPVLLAVGVFVSWRQQRLRPLIAVVVGLGTAYLLGKWIKEGLGRTAPFLEVDILHGIGQAFPSGHVANATYSWALITLLFFGERGLWPNRRRVFIGFGVTAGLVVLVGGIMVINDYHWFTDLPGGVAVGLIALMAALIVLGPASGTARSSDE
jgi:membrane-associated phospholipid phosphatase